MRGVVWPTLHHAGSIVILSLQVTHLSPLVSLNNCTFYLYVEVTSVEKWSELLKYYESLFVITVEKFIMIIVTL